MRVRENGFVLVEVLPALLLLLMSVGAASRILWLVSEERLAGLQRMGLESALEAVSREWAGRDETAAVATWEEDGTLRVVLFPDESWLPPPGSTARGFPQHYRFRRKPRPLADGSWIYRIEWNRAESPQTGNWRVVTATIHLPSAP